MLATPDGAADASSRYPQLIVLEGTLAVTWYEESGQASVVRVALFDDTQGAWLPAGTAAGETAAGAAVRRVRRANSEVQANGAVHANGTVHANGAARGLLTNSDAALWSRLSPGDGGAYLSWHELDTGGRLRVRVAQAPGAPDRWDWRAFDGGGLRWDSGGEADYASLAVLDGTVYAAWREVDAGRTAFRIRVARRTTSGWGPVEHTSYNESVSDAAGASGLNVDLAQDAYYPKLATHDGALWIAWYERLANSSAQRLHVARLDQQTQLWELRTPRTTGLHVADSARIAGPQIVSVGDSLAALWVEEPLNAPGSLYVSFVSTDSGSPVASEAIGLRVESGAEIGWARAAAWSGTEPAPLLAVAWSETGDDTSAVHAALLDPRVPDRTPQMLSPPTGLRARDGAIASYPHVVASPDGIVIAWEEFVQGRSHLAVARFDLL